MNTFWIVDLWICWFAELWNCWFAELFICWIVELCNCLRRWALHNERYLLIP